MSLNELRHPLHSSLRRIAQFAPTSSHLDSDQAAAVSCGRDECAYYTCLPLILCRGLASREDVSLRSVLCSTYNDVMEEMGVIEDAIRVENTYWERTGPRKGVH